MGTSELLPCPVCHAEVDNGTLWTVCRTCNWNTYTHYWRAVSVGEAPYPAGYTAPKAEVPVPPILGGPILCPRCGKPQPRNGPYLMPCYCATRAEIEALAKPALEPWAIVAAFLACCEEDDPMFWWTKKGPEWIVAMSKAVNEPHCGDCTKVAVTCMRCWTEKYKPRAEILVATLAANLEGKK